MSKTNKPSVGIIGNTAKIPTLYHNRQNVLNTSSFTIHIKRGIPSLTCATLALGAASQAMWQKAFCNFHSPCYSALFRFPIFLSDHDGLIIYSSLGRTEALWSSHAALSLRISARRTFPQNGGTKAYKWQARLLQLGRFNPGTQTKEIERSTTSAKDKNTRIYMSTLPYVFMA
jgi:hypothetical protein